NSGLVPVPIAGVALGGTNPGDFTVDAGSCAGTTLAPGGSCTVGVGFGPTAAGSLSARLTITDNARTSPQTVPLSGIGTAPPASTPVPPTNTPVPPTNTPAPPTSTPR